MGKRVPALLLAALFLCLFAFSGFAEETAACEATAIARECLMPFLEANPKAAMIFAAELNISNGDPDAREYGERGMFGRLMGAADVLEEWDTWEQHTTVILEEVNRLLFGPWENGGHTEFSFAERSDVRALDYETGTWSECEDVQTIRIEHSTEYTGKRRVTHIICDPFRLRLEGYYLACFEIVRA